MTALIFTAVGFALGVVATNVIHALTITLDRLDDDLEEWCE